jgi:hypothetical protein
MTPVLCRYCTLCDLARELGLDSLPRNVSRLAVDFIVDMGSLSLFSREVAANLVQRHVASDNDGDNGGLSAGNQALLAVFLNSVE